MSAVDVRGLSVVADDRGRSVLALSDVNLTIARGEIVGVIGESGSGKTTLIRSMVGLLRPNVHIEAGTIAYDDSPVFGPDRNDLASVRGRKVSLVFQNPSSSLNPLKTIGAQIREVLHVHRLVTRRGMAGALRDLLAQVGFEDPERVARSYPHQLSGGMCQRAAVAAALAAQPEILVTDEATSALDVTSQAEIIELLQAVARERNLTLIFVTHDLLLASELCSRLVVMYGGQIVEDGPTAEVVAAPQHRYTQALLGAVPLWQPRTELRGIPGSPPTVEAGFTGCRLAARCPSATPECRADDIGWVTVDATRGHRCLHPVGRQPVRAEGLS